MANVNVKKGNLPFVVRAGVKYVVYWDNRVVMETTLRSDVTDTVRGGVVGLLKGEIRDVRIEGSDASKFVIGVKESLLPLHLRGRGKGAAR